jgi:hypothetical protein
MFTIHNSNFFKFNLRLSDNGVTQFSSSWLFMKKKAVSEMSREFHLKVGRIRKDASSSGPLRAAPLLPQRI